MVFPCILHAYFFSPLGPLPVMNGTFIIQPGVINNLTQEIIVSWEVSEFIKFKLSVLAAVILKLFQANLHGYYALLDHMIISYIMYHMLIA